MKYEEYNSLLMEYSKAVCYICDAESYEMLHLTKAGMEICGLKSSEDYLGKKCYEILQGSANPCPFCTNFKIKENETYHWEYYNEKLGKWFLINNKIVNIDGRMCRMEISQDIDEIKKDLTELSNRLSLEDFLLQSVSIFANEKDITTAVNTFLEMIANYI